jgi:hypothetical protein
MFFNAPSNDYKSSQKNEKKRGKKTQISTYHGFFFLFCDMKMMPIL